MGHNTHPLKQLWPVDPGQDGDQQPPVLVVSHAAPIVALAHGVLKIVAATEVC